LNKSRSSISNLTKKFGLKKYNDIVEWTNEEVKILKENYSLMYGKDICNLLPSKTYVQIIYKAKYLKLNHDKSIRFKYDRIEIINNNQCTICGKEISNLYFKHQLCKECYNKIVILNMYKRKYNIILDINKMFDSYSLIQWYRWKLLDTTPNGKHIKIIPIEINTLENIKIICKYVIEDILQLKTRTQKLQLTQSTMIKYKISYTKSFGIYSNPYNLLTLVFPELNIQPWEMPSTPDAFWLSYDNFLLSVKFYVYDILNEDMRNNIEAYFSSKCIIELFPKLFLQKFRYHKEKTWKEILNDIGIYYDTNKNLKSTYDGEILKSMEEVKIYNFIHKKLNINTLKVIKGKYIFKCNNGIDKRYIPDFYITEINDIKLNKPCIIEYYGLFINDYRTVKTLTDEILNNYKDKTNRKNDFYKNNPDIYFIDLYPQDLKNNFEGVRQKITSFFMSNFNIDINS